MVENYAKAFLENFEYDKIIICSTDEKYYTVSVHCTFIITVHWGLVIKYTNMSIIVGISSTFWMLCEQWRLIFEM